MLNMYLLALCLPPVTILVNNIYSLPARLERSEAF